MGKKGPPTVVEATYSRVVLIEYSIALDNDVTTVVDSPSRSLETSLPADRSLGG